MPMRGELPCRAARLCRDSSACESVYSRIIATITDPELELIICFCVIGLLITVFLVHAFPNFGEMVETLEQFP
jgi:hypothetical protein